MYVCVHVNIQTAKQFNDEKSLHKRTIAHSYVPGIFFPFTIN